MMTYGEAMAATLDQLTDELAAAGWDSTQQTREEALEAVLALIAETQPNSEFHGIRTMQFKSNDTYLSVLSSDVLEMDGLEHFNSSQLGLELVVLPTGEVVDVASMHAYLLDEDRLEECEQNIVDWMDQADTKSASDFRGEAATDWDWIVRTVKGINV